MPHPKSMYKKTKDGMLEEFAMSFKEECKYLADGWYGHPEEARLLYRDKMEKVILSDMNKKQLEEYARTFGIELDRRKSKDNMLIELEELLK